MNLQKLHHSLLAALGYLAAAAANGAEINGTVRQAGGDAAKIVVATDLVPNVGDKVDIYFKIPGGEDEVGVGKGSVTDVRTEIVTVKIESTTGTIARGQLARFASANPQKKTAAAPLPTPPTVAPPTMPLAKPLTKPEPPPFNPPAEGAVFNFDALPPGAFAVNAFAARGVRFVAEKGEPLVFDAEPNMILPGDRRKVLLLGGEHVTSLTITFDEPVRRFGLTRIGTRGGASVPTWKLEAFDADGKVVASANEERGLPKTPQAFSVSGSAVVKVRLSTDNRFGNTVWATWSSLPVAEFEIER